MQNRTVDVARDVRGTGWLLPLRAEPPRWAQALASAQPGRWRLLVEAIPGPEALSASGLEEAVADAYRRLARTLADTRLHPVRFWNFIPGIHADLGDGLDRYMAFNAGRYGAFHDWFGSAAMFTRDLPTASAVGVAGGPLLVHALGCAAPGSPVENPRQIPAYSYSRRYGPLPPCFARATRLTSTGADADPPALLVGGTASIVGEDSLHERHARAQTGETLDNLAHLVARAFGIAPAHALRAFTDLRVYIVREEDADDVRTLVDARFPQVAHIEYAQADLCRRELLVEIEGTAMPSDE